MDPVKIMSAQENASATLSWQGQEFEADENGVFEVPFEAFLELQSHGFVPYVDGRGQENR